MQQWLSSDASIGLRRHSIPVDIPQGETRYHVSSLRTGAKALLKSSWHRWFIKNSWYCVRDAPLNEGFHRIWKLNGFQILSTLRSLVINVLRIDRICSITEVIRPCSLHQGLLRRQGR